MAILITILLFLIMLKITGFILSICGKILGIAFSIIGYLILGAFAVFGLGMTLLTIPILLVLGVIWIFRLIL